MFWNDSTIVIIYVHDKNTIVCYFYGKTGHMTSKCRDSPKKGTTNTFMANTKGLKKIWVPKKKIIPVAGVLDSNKQTSIMVPGQWLLMTHDMRRGMFHCLTPYHGGTITFEGNKKGRITWVCKIGIHPYPSIDNVLFVEGLKPNVLSISKSCGSGYDVSFNKDECVVLCKDGSPIFSAKRKGKIY